MSSWKHLGKAFEEQNCSPHSREEKGVKRGRGSLSYLAGLISSDLKASHWVLPLKEPTTKLGTKPLTGTLLSGSITIHRMGD